MPGRLLFLPADCQDDSDWLLSRIQMLLRPRGGPASFIASSRSDPTLMWEDVFGWLDGRGKASSPQLLFIRGGHWLPYWSLEFHVPVLDALCKGAGTVLIIPVCRQTEGAIRASAYSCTLLDIPTLKSADLSDRERLAMLFLKASLADEDIGTLNVTVSDQAAICRAVALSAGSRVAARDIMVRIARMLGEQAHADEILAVLPNLLSDTEDSHRPSPVETAHSLRKRFDDSIGTLAEESRRFDELFGRPLVRPCQHLPHPFDARDPWHWFFALVTRLYILVNDFPARRGLSVISRCFRFDAKTGQVCSGVLTPLPARLHALRTSYQHGIDPANQDDNESNALGQAKEWCRSVVGSDNVSREHGRVLADALLSEWESALGELARVLSDPIEPMVARAIQAALDDADRQIPQHELQAAFKRAVALLMAPLDVEKLLQIYGDRCRKEIRDCAFSGVALHDFVQRLAEEFVAEQVAKCPVDASWLINHGVARGPLIGEWLDKFKRDWESIAIPRDQDAFLRRANDLLEAADDDAPEDSSQ